jgi:peptidoglycan/xylan/chitin deacetylase (PgdA/CDA1 family)
MPDTPFHLWWRQVPPHQHGPESSSERPPRTQHIDWHSRYPDVIILNGPRNRRTVALSFDDGPDDLWTPRILSVLSEYSVHATFCCVGQRIQQNPQVLERMVREGHIIANHTWSHPNFTKVSLDVVRTEVERTNDEIRRVAGVTPRFLRPPYGALNQAVIERVRAMTMKILLWDVDSLDWSGLSGPQVAANVLSHTEPGSIILLHSAGGRGESLEDTVDALPYIIEVLRRENYTFATVPELLNQPAYR